MTPDVPNTVARLRVRVQDLRDQVLTLLREELRHLIISRHDLLIEVTRLWVFERQIPGHHRVKNDSRRPNIGLETVVALTLDHLSNMHIN